MTFKEYIATRRAADTPAGDFTEDARRDCDLPDVTSWEELRRYIERKVGGPVRDAVVAAAREVWQDYWRTLSKR